MITIYWKNKVHYRRENYIDNVEIIPSVEDLLRNLYTLLNS